jgi:hypothetical protein
VRLSPACLPESVASSAPEVVEAATSSDTRQTQSKPLTEGQGQLDAGLKENRLFGPYLLNEYLAF